MTTIRCVDVTTNPQIVADPEDQLRRLLCKHEERAASVIKGGPRHSFRANHWVAFCFLETDEKASSTLIRSCEQKKTESRRTFERGIQNVGFQVGSLAHTCSAGKEAATPQIFGDRDNMTFSELIILLSG